MLHTGASLISLLASRVVLSLLQQIKLEERSFLLAVSGGRDSVVLLHLFHELRQEPGMNIGVIHVDHALRDSSRGDAEFVASLARELDFPYWSTRLESPTAKMNVEAWGRRERYSFFEKQRHANSFRWMVTAHHAGDVIETYLMRILSNKEPRNIEARCERRSLLRPLLMTFPEEIDAYVQEQGITFCEDPTNRDVTFLRNRIRHELLPFLRQTFGADIDRILFARSQAEASRIQSAEAWAMKRLEILDAEDFGSRTYRRQFGEIVKTSSPSDSWRLAACLLYSRLGYRLSKARASECIDVLAGERVACQLPGSWELRKKDGGFRLFRI